MKYTPDSKGISRYLVSDADLRKELRRRAEIGLGLARSRAPRRSGRLAASGHLDDVTLSGGRRRGARMAVNIVFDVDYAAATTYPKSDRATKERRRYLTDVIPAIERG